MLKSLILNQFKGVTHYEIDFGEFLTEICGANGVGKTTLATAHWWLWNDCDYDLHSNPEIHPTFLLESIPSVAEIWEINGKEYVFRKFQEDIRTKKQKEQDAPVRVANRYEINSVPKSQKEFFKAVEDLGVDVDNFLMFSHTDVLLNKKVADRREVVFALAGNVTTAEVAETIPECREARILIDKGYKDDEIIAMAKSDAKKASEHMTSLPNQIIGLEKAKIPIDTSLLIKRDELEELISEKTAERESCVAKSDSSKYDEQIRKLDNDKHERYNQANTERLLNLSESHKIADKLRDKHQEAKRSLNELINNGNRLNDGFRRQNELKKVLTASLEAEKANEFSTNTICPTCGQEIPKADIDKARANWEENHQKTIKDLTDRLNAAETMVADYLKEGKELSKQKLAVQNTIAEKEEQIVDIQKIIDSLSEPIKPDCSDIDAAIEEVKSQMADVNSYKDRANALTAEIRAAKTELADVIKQLGQQGNNERIDAEIENLRNELDGYIQAKADAENVLYQMQLISQRKNELLSDAVNSHFTRVKWRLFIVQKNGEIKDDCTPLVLCADGKYRDITYSANTAAIMAAKIDICRGLQKFYGQHLPIWVDGAECFDEKNRKALATNDTQLILLCVTEDKEMVVK